MLKNLSNTKAMVCKPGLILGQQGTAAYKSRVMVEDMFCEQKKTRVSCKECRGGVEVSLIHHYMDITHSIVLQ